MENVGLDDERNAQVKDVIDENCISQAQEWWETKFQLKEAVFRCREREPFFIIICKPPTSQAMMSNNLQTERIGLGKGGGEPDATRKHVTEPFTRHILGCR